MATIVTPAREQGIAEPAAYRGQCVELHGVSWDTYLGLLETEESLKGSVRMSYNQGRLLIMTLSRAHELDSERLSLIVRLAAAGMGVTCQGVGRTTLKSDDTRRGKEADCAFYLANEPSMRRTRELDLSVDPPPDLAIEVEAAHRDPQMLAIYASIGVPEVWVYDEGVVRALLLQPDGSYRPTATSISLPLLPLHEIPRWLARAVEVGESVMTIEFLDWVRNDLAARNNRGDEGTV